MKSYNVLRRDSRGYTTLHSTVCGDDPSQSLADAMRLHPGDYPAGMGGELMRYEVQYESAREIPDDSPAAVAHH